VIISATNIQQLQEDDNQTNELSMTTAADRSVGVYDEIVSAGSNSHVEITSDDIGGTTNCSYQRLDPTSRETPSFYDHVACHKLKVEV
jgi:hypothetical protein